MKFLNKKNFFILMAVLVTLICGVVSQEYYTNNEDYNNNIRAYWRYSFRREAPVAPPLNGREFRSNYYNTQKQNPPDDGEDDYPWSVGLL
ncbi:UNVERIFIED_CONTAM: hypothetical protein RMT77_005759 [Armadillidium vulgare]